MSGWRARKWSALADSARIQAERWEADQRYTDEARRDQRELRESYQDAGLVLVGVRDSYTFSSQPFALDAARSSAQASVSVLRALGFSAHALLVDFVPVSVRCPYWGGTYSANRGAYHILVDGVPMVGEMAKRAYEEYWKARGLEGITL
jgi:hypothetical protein